MPRKPKAILRDVKKLAREYFAATGRPLGATGEIAEYEAAMKLGLHLSVVRSAGFDATSGPGGKGTRYQIKGRRPADGSDHGVIPRVNLARSFKYVLLVDLDKRYNAIGIWKAKKVRVRNELTRQTKSGATRRSLNVTKFKSIAEHVWPPQK